MLTVRQIEMSLACATMAMLFIASSAVADAPYKSTSHGNPSPNEMESMQPPAPATPATPPAVSEDVQRRVSDPEANLGAGPLGQATGSGRWFGDWYSNRPDALWHWESELQPGFNSHQRENIARHPGSREAQARREGETKRMAAREETYRDNYPELG